MFKGLTRSIMIIAFMLVGVPVLMALTMLGPNEYGRQCNLNLMPCFGLGDDDE